MDSGSSCNCCSAKLVKKIDFPTKPHLKPYNLQWINNDGGIVVNEQVSTPISIGKYFEYVLFDIVPMETGYIILGQPWQYDNKIIHNGHTYRITFQHIETKMNLIPLSPQQVREDEIKLREKMEKESSKNKEKQKKGELELISRKENIKRVCMLLNTSQKGKKFNSCENFQKLHFEESLHCMK